MEEALRAAAQQVTDTSWRSIFAFLCAPSENVPLWEVLCTGRGHVAELEVCSVVQRASWQHDAGSFLRPSSDPDDDTSHVEEHYTCPSRRLFLETRRLIPVEFQGKPRLRVNVRRAHVTCSSKMLVTTYRGTCHFFFPTQICRSPEQP